MLLLLIVVPCVVIGLAAVFLLDRGGVLPRFEMDRSAPNPVAARPAVRQRVTIFPPSHADGFFADRLRRVVAVMIVFSILMPVLVLDVLAATIMSVSVSGPLPAPRPPVGTPITEVYDAAGNEIASFHQFATNVMVPPEDIPQVLKRPSWRRRIGGSTTIVVSTPPVCCGPCGPISAVVTCRGGVDDQPAIVRLVYGSSTRSLSRKVHEAVLAGRVNAQLSKDEILYGYLSRAYFGAGA